jgi:hypothetical protein
MEPHHADIWVPLFELYVAFDCSMSNTTQESHPRHLQCVARNRFRNKMKFCGVSLCEAQNRAFSVLVLFNRINSLFVGHVQAPEDSLHCLHDGRGITGCGPPPFLCSTDRPNLSLGSPDAGKTVLCAGECFVSQRWSLPPLLVLITQLSV